jgi:hypothetical protein
MNDQNDRTTDCDRAREELPALLYGELDAESAAELEKHLASCPDCRAELQAHEQTKALLNRWPEPMPPTAPVVPTPLTATDKSGRGRIIRLLRPVMYGAAAAVVVFGLLVLFGAEARYDDGQLTVTLGQSLATDVGPSGLTDPGANAVLVRRVAGEEYDQRIEGLLELIGEELYELNRRHERDQLLLAQAFELRREQDRAANMAALEALARGIGRDSARHRQALADVYDLIEPGGVVPANYVEPQRKD